jgi:hypothetical protein
MLYYAENEQLLVRPYLSISDLAKIVSSIILCTQP